MPHTATNHTHDIPAIILAGGLGTRLQRVVSDLPKPMAPVNGKPFLHYVLKQLAAQSITHAVLSVGHKSEAIVDFFGHEYEGIHLSYAHEREPLGTGGAIREAFRYVDGVAYVLNGDTFFNASLSALKDTYFETGADIAFSLKQMHHFERYGTVELNAENRIIQFKEKKHTEEGLINGGIYLMNKRVFELIEFWNECVLPEKFSFEADILERYTNRLKLYAKVFDGYFIDIGIPEDYQKAQQELPAILG